MVVVGGRTGWVGIIGGFKPGGGLAGKPGGPAFGMAPVDGDGWEGYTVG